MNSKAKILLIYTGGTIGMRKDFDTGALKAFNFSKLLQKFRSWNNWIVKLKLFHLKNNWFLKHESGRMGENSKHSRVQLFGFMGLLSCWVRYNVLFCVSIELYVLKTVKPLFFGSQLPIGFAYRCQRKFNYRYSNCFFARKWVPLLLRYAFILNISCIEEERPRSMRNILRHSRHQLSAMVESGVHLNMRRLF
jgi:L-asparaginase